MKFVVTGFREFSGVKENPTEFIVNNLQDYLRVRGKPLPGGAEAVNFTALKVAGREVSDWLALAAKTISDGVPEESEIIWIHFGVDTHAKTFKLEVRAKNEASFRCPDQDGWQPNHEAIDTEKCIDSYLYTDLPIKAIIASMGPETCLSTSAGLFVCNYTLYCSLRQCSQHSKGRASKWHALFVHVPPFSVVSAEKQIRYAAKLLDVLAITMTLQPSTLYTPHAELLQAVA